MAASLVRRGLRVLALGTALCSGCNRSVSHKPPPWVEASCDQLPLLASRDANGALQGLYVRVERENAPSLLRFDTSTPTTHLSARSGAGRVRMFCVDRNIEGWPAASREPPFRELPVIGTLGTDIFESGVIEVDAQRGVFVLHRLPAKGRSESLPGTEGWRRIPLARDAGTTEIALSHLGSDHFVIDQGRGEVLVASPGK